MRRAAAAAALAFAVNGAPGLSAVGTIRFPGVQRRIDGATDAVALTFDDGPHPQGTPAMLEALDRLGMRATFYLVGRESRRDPGVAREVVAAGHELGLHGDRHRPHVAMPPWWVMRDLDRGLAAIEDVTGVRPQSLRAPFGAAAVATLAFGRRRDMRVVGWTRWGRDWERGATGESVARRVVRGLGAGDILLLHDSDTYAVPGSWRATLAALPAIASALAERGLRADVLSPPGSVGQHA
jgi:peptidoglycan/xylan/chitin deacetylase (PgdA/CDA1 family)